MTTLEKCRVTNFINDGQQHQQKAGPKRLALAQPKKWQIDLRGKILHQCASSDSLLWTNHKKDSKITPNSVFVKGQMGKAVTQL